MEPNAARIRTQGLGLAAISYDSVAILKHFADRSHISFPLLSDPDSAVIRRYGSLNETVAKDNSAYGIPTQVYTSWTAGARYGQVFRG